MKKAILFSIPLLTACASNHSSIKTANKTMFDKQVHRVTIQSFDFRTLQYVHSKFHKVKTSALIDAGDTNDLQQLHHRLGFTPDIYSPHYSLVTRAFIKSCHEKQIAVIPWTVNSVAKMKH